MALQLKYKAYNMKNSDSNNFIKQQAWDQFKKELCKKNQIALRYIWYYEDSYVVISEYFQELGLTTKLNKKLSISIIYEESSTQFFLFAEVVDSASVLLISVDILGCLIKKSKQFPNSNAPLDHKILYLLGNYTSLLGEVQQDFPSCTWPILFQFHNQRTAVKASS
ncbi:hypothetical protein C1645_834484 [Glomus cerebriforme]|uniref:Uncharacterized protein n=1 Tax=Glomus cerebriforme TaxID=658196 RepID=A0A397S9H5_9GLOM|nr:hypothetical protein C1645_834484 [Glomus cerebriforme]